MSKVHIFTNHFYPENFRINEISEALSEEHDVMVITQTPNYPKGKFFPGYSWFKKSKEKIGDVSVKRLPVIPRGTNSITLMLNYTSYIISSFFYSVFTKVKPDYVFVYITSPIFISWAGLRVARKNNVPSTLYLLDLWPDVLFSMLNIKNKAVRSFFEKMTINIYKQFDHIMVSSYSFIEVLVNYGISRDKITYMPQHSEQVNLKSTRPCNEIFTVIFTGNIGEAQGLDVLVETAEIMQEHQMTDVKFMIVGDGRYKDTLQKMIKDMNLDNYFNFVGRVKPEQIPNLLEKADVGFVSLNDDVTLNKTLPAKVQTYLAYGIPILASANGEIPWLINQAQAGLSVPAGNSNELFEAILKFKAFDKKEIEQYSINGFNYAKKNFAKNTLFNKINDTITNR